MTEDCMTPPPTGRPISERRRRRSKGRELLDFVLILFPLLAMISLLVDTAWAVFAESTLQRAVRIGVRTGVTLTASQMVGSACLTDTVKGVVQANSFGLLRGASGLALIKVNYLQPPPSNSSSAATDVSAQSNGDAPGNIMQVSVQNFSLVPLMPHFFSRSSGSLPVGGATYNNTPLIITVNSADMIEPDRNPPCIGTAP
jgi:Flp pilus assembly protein TadG